MPWCSFVTSTSISFFSSMSAGFCCVDDGSWCLGIKRTLLLLDRAAVLSFVPWGA